MMAQAASERFNDRNQYGGLTIDIILEKVCEAERRDLARSTKSGSQDFIEIMFNHTEVSKRATDQQHHKEEMVRQADSARSKSQSNGSRKGSDGSDQQGLQKCVFCNGPHLVNACPTAQLPLTGNFDDKDWKHPKFNTFSLICRMCERWARYAIQMDHFSITRRCPRIAR